METEFFAAEMFDSVRTLSVRRVRNGMSEEASDEQVFWYALTTRSQHEKKAVEALDLRGFQTFLPLYRARRRWSDRTKVLDLPLFPGYVFCRFAVEHRVRVLTSPNIAAVVGIGKQPVPLADEEILAIKTMIASGLRVEPWQFLEVGQKVRLEGGALDGLIGILVQEKNSLRVVVNVELLHRSVAVEISRERLAPEREAWRRPAAAAAP
jgi:transcription antitermination factor NusG